MAHRIWKETKQEPGTAGLLLSFFPFPLDHPEHEHCIVRPFPQVAPVNPRHHGDVGDSKRKLRGALGLPLQEARHADGPHDMEHEFLILPADTPSNSGRRQGI